MIRRVLHKFGVHHWSEWSEPKDELALLGSCNIAIVKVQQHTCFICNKTATRIMELVK